jgi:hypothetical protein
LKGPPVESPPARRPSGTPIVVSSGLFSPAHLGNGPDPIPIFFLALGLGYLYRQTHRLWPGIVVRALLNAFSTAVLVSGIDAQPAASARILARRFQACDFAREAIESLSPQTDDSGRNGRHAPCFAAEIADPKRLRLGRRFIDAGFYRGGGRRGAGPQAQRPLCARR